MLIAAALAPSVPRNGPLMRAAFISRVRKKIECPHDQDELEGGRTG